ncbi:MAG: hypothetical protein VX494_14795 [Actinomycetota bacterium]|nr:hypothetical protein [Actinomycetota bacterium]MEE3128472.1 hypothetical protein [Actinomycetota bacterium]
MGVEALVDDDAVQLATTGATAWTGVGGALLGRHGAGKACRGRRGSDMVVAVPVAPLAQQRGGLLPERVLEVRRRRSADRLVDGLLEQLVTADVVVVDNRFGEVGISLKYVSARIDRAPHAAQAS